MAYRANTFGSRRAFLKSTLVAGAGMAIPASGQTVQIGATPEPSQVSDLFHNLEDLVTSRMDEYRVPGVAIGVRAGDDEFIGGYGVSNIDQPQAVDAETRFGIGSLTKTFTGTAIMRLVEQGRVDLEAPVRAYLPDFQVADEAVADQATLRHLVTHTAGWYGDRFPETGQGDDALARYVAGMANLPQVAPLGEYFSYNNAAIATAGRVVEVVTGRPYEDALNELVLSPLNLEESRFLSEDVDDATFAVGHTTSEGEPVVLEAPPIPRAANPIAGLASSVSDLLRYARFHLGNGTAGDGHVLSSAGLSRMQEPLGPGGTNTAVVLDGVGVTWWLLSRAGEERVITHLGSSDGLESLLVLVPEREFALAILTNAQTGLALAVETMDWALERFLGLTAPPRSPVTISQTQLEEYIGEYSFGDGVAIRIEERDADLVLEQHVPDLDSPVLAAPLRFVGPDMVAFEDLELTLLSDFVRDDSGRIGWFRFAGRLCPRIE